MKITKLATILGLTGTLALAGCGTSADDPTPEAPASVTPAPFVPTATPTNPPVPSRVPGVTPDASNTPVPSPTGEVVPTVAPTDLPAPTAAQAPPAALAPVVGGGVDPAQVRLDLTLVADRLNNPTSVADAGDVAGRLYVTEKLGRIRIIQGGGLVTQPFLEIRDKVTSSGPEDGLLGLAFHPSYLSNGLFFIYYNDRANQTVLARYRVSANPDLADPASETILLTIDQPTPEHNGGQLAFGPDGYLYLSVGDGGQSGSAQDGGSLRGSILRLDVNGGSPYGIPPGNPFAGNAGTRDEIWATGLRNPWRFSFDRATGELYIADVGDLSYEEVNVQPAGAGGQNYGWPVLEGTHCYPGGEPCSQPGTVAPVFENTRNEGCAIIGGYVYRGAQNPLLNGTYLFGDYCNGTIWGLRRTAAGAWQSAVVYTSDFLIGTFGEDRTGELYVVNTSRGEVYLIRALPR